MNTYRIRLSRLAEQTITIVVNADSEEEARDIAEADDNFSNDDIISIESEEITGDMNYEIDSVTEIAHG